MIRQVTFGFLISMMSSCLNENDRSGALYNTVLKLVCLQQKASHQTSMHRACGFFVKNWVCDARKASPNVIVSLQGLSEF